MKAIKLTEQTSIQTTWGAMIFIITSALAIASWLTVLQINDSNRAIAISEMKEENKAMLEMIHRIDVNVIEIRTYLKNNGMKSNE